MTLRARLALMLTLAGLVGVGLLTSAGPASAAALAAPSIPDRPAAPEVLADALDALSGAAAGDERVGRNGLLDSVGHGPTAQLMSLALVVRDLEGAERDTAEAILARPSDDTGGPGGSFEIRYGDAPTTWHDTASIRVHYATAGEHQATPSFAAAVGNAMELALAHQTSALGWPKPIADGSRGGDARTDVYLADLAGRGYAGYAATDSGQSCQRGPQTCTRFHGYMVLDRSYSHYSDPMGTMRSVAAHELHHILQYALDVASDTWFYESGAEWAALSSFPGDDRTTSRLRSWAQRPHESLLDHSTTRMYGSFVLQRWISDRHGDDVVRRAWDHALGQEHNSLGGLDRALAGAGTDLPAEFTALAAATAEWDASPLVRRASGPIPSVPRTDTVSGQVNSALDPASYRLYDVALRGRVRATLTVPADVSGGVGLVVRRGGNAEFATASRRTGGTVSVAVDATGADRVTLVVANPDHRMSDPGRYNHRNDWTPLLSPASYTTRVEAVSSLDVPPPSSDPDSPNPPAPTPEPEPAGPAPLVHGGRTAAADGNAVAQAVTTSRSLFADGTADRVVLATADRFPDALAGAPLAGDRGPILFTGAEGALDGRTAEEIARVTGGSGHVVILGGEKAVSAEAAAAAIAAAGGGACPAPIPTSCRLSGPAREHTAVAIAEVVVAEHGAPEHALVARMDDFADAITGGAYAAAAGVPVLLTPTDIAHPETAAFLTRHGIAEVVALGGPVAVSDATLAAFPGQRHVRVAGRERTETAVRIAEALWGRSNLDRGHAVVVNVRSDWQSALAASVASAVHGAPQLGVEANQAPGPASTGWLASRPADGAVHAFGTAAAIDEAVLRAAADAAH